MFGQRLFDKSTGLVGQANSGCYKPDVGCRVLVVNQQGYTGGVSMSQDMTPRLDSRPQRVVVVVVEIGCTIMGYLMQCLAGQSRKSARCATVASGVQYLL